MLRAFRAWAPESDEKWFFDKSVWQKLFRAMGGCGLKEMIFANGRICGEDPAGDFAQMRQWILRSTLDYGITPYLAIDPGNDFDPKMSVEQAHGCMRGFLETYPDLKGLFVSFRGNVDFVQPAIVDALDAVRPDASLYIEACGDPSGIADGIKRRANRPICYSVRYSHGYLVDSNPDPSFSAWIDAVGAENVAAEIVAVNFEPWTSFSYDTAEGIAANVEELGCDGFSLQPLSVSEWPQTSDTSFKHQWQRDLVWYSVWGGTSVQQLARQGQPKWLVRNSRLVPGFEASSRVLEILSLYFAGDKRGSWRPQFCSVMTDGEGRLLTIEDMLNLEIMDSFSGLKWWQEITEDRVVHLREYVISGTPEEAYGPEELIEELDDLANQAVAAGEKGMRNNSGEKELPSFSRDALCMGRLGEFYVERLRAALAHARGEDAEAAEHITRALGFYRELVETDESHREDFAITGAGGDAIAVSWASVLAVLEAEQADAARGVFLRGAEYPATL